MTGRSDLSDATVADVAQEMTSRRKFGTRTAENKPTTRASSRQSLILSSNPAMTQIIKVSDAYYPRPGEESHHYRSPKVVLVSFKPGRRPFNPLSHRLNAARCHRQRWCDRIFKGGWHPNKFLQIACGLRARFFGDEMRPESFEEVINVKGDLAQDMTA